MIAAICLNMWIPVCNVVTCLKTKDMTQTRVLKSKTCSSQISRSDWSFPNFSLQNKDQL